MEQEVVDALQAQFSHERTNAQRYYYLADVMRNMAYDGFAKFFKAQADGEMGHAQVIADLLISKRIQPMYGSCGFVLPDSDLLIGYATFAYRTELTTTEALKSVYAVAEDNQDPQVCALINTLLVEQIEEESVTADLVDQLSRTDANGWEILNAQYK